VKGRDGGREGTLGRLLEVGAACMRILFYKDLQSLIETPQSLHGLVVSANRCPELGHARNNQGNVSWIFDRSLQAK
jgi:hypothetical protein